MLWWSTKRFGVADARLPTGRDQVGENLLPALRTAEQRHALRRREPRSPISCVDWTKGLLSNEFLTIAHSGLHEHWAPIYLGV